MKIAILYSGGKDSNYALYKSYTKHDIVCLISIISKNDYSYMFQSTNYNILKYQSKALNIPLFDFKTKGEEEKELEDLKSAIKLAIDKYSIEGIVTGAINSTYQSSRIQKICKELDIWCFNPLWQKDQIELLKELIENKFEVIIANIASYPLTKEFLGKKIDIPLLNQFIDMQKKYKINPAGEGGELETLVLNSPLFHKKIKIEKSRIRMDSENSGALLIDKIKLVDKK